MNRALACILAIAGWYLLYPPATDTGNPHSYTAMSHWSKDGSMAQLRIAVRLTIAM